jgi:hypothetical protein
LVNVWKTSFTLWNPYTIYVWSWAEGGRKNNIVVSVYLGEWAEHLSERLCLLLSWRTKLCQLLCLKYCGSMVLANSVGFFTLKTSPSFDHDIRCCMSSSATILDSRIEERKWKEEISRK